MNSVPTADDLATNKVSWRQAVAKYENPDLQRSVWQVVNTVIPYCILWYLMYRSLEVSYWITLALSALAAGFLGVCSGLRFILAGDANMRCIMPPLAIWTDGGWGISGR